MLNSSTLAMSMPLAEQLDANGIALTAIPGTPLDHLIKACEVPSDATLSNSETGEYFVDFIRVADQANTVVPLFDKSRHDYVLGDIKIVGADAVRRVIGIIRNKAAPTIGELVELVNARLAAAPVSQLSSLEIATNESSAALYNPALSGLIEKYELMPPAEPTINTALPRIPAAEIMPLLETGIASLDTDVAQWIASVPPYELEAIWNDFFCALTPRNDEVERGSGFGTVTSVQTPFTTLIDQNEVTRLVVFLIARHLLENEVVLDNTEMSLSSYNETLKTYVEQAGRLLNRQLEKNSASITNGVLVTAIKGNTIVVNTPVYNSWLANGGDNDILFGMVLSGRPTYNVATLDANREQYRDIWKQKVAILTSTESAQRFNFLREQLVLCYEDMLNREENEEGIKLNAREIFEYMKCFKDNLECISIQESQDLYNVCLKLVCRTRFSKIPAEQFLLKMDEIARTQPKLTAKEAATLAMLDYICDWVASQFQPIAV